MGWLLLAGQAGNELAIIILPVMVTMIGYTDGVHLVVRIRQLKAAGSTARDAVFHAVETVGPACLLTSVTTAIGFGSLKMSRMGSNIQTGTSRRLIERSGVKPKLSPAVPNETLRRCAHNRDSPSARAADTE